VAPDHPTDLELDAAGRALARWAGLSLTAGLRTTLREAVAAAARELGTSPAALVRRAGASEPEALGVLSEHAVVGETFFWRHPEGVEALVGRLADHPSPLRLWSAGCASGEEPYGLAMALLSAGRVGHDDRILATDLSERALATARAGRYTERALRKLPDALAERWLRQCGAQAEVAPAVRERVEVRRHNLLSTAPEGPFHAVVCRNVVIYFEAREARAALERLAGVLAPGGWLLLGPVELALAEGVGLEWHEVGGAVLLRRPGA